MKVRERNKSKERKEMDERVWDFDLLYLTNKNTIISQNKERKKGFDSQIIVFFNVLSFF